MVAQLLNLAMRGAQFLWTLLTMALVGNMIASAFAGNPSIINYTMFISVFSMLSLFYLVPATLKPDFSLHPALAVGLDALNSIFFLCGGIALAAYLGVHSCGNNTYTHTNRITNGASDTRKRCHEAQASTAFVWFAFLAYAASTVLSGLQSRGAGTTVNLRGIRRGRASQNMSQV